MNPYIGWSTTRKIISTLTNVTALSTSIYLCAAKGKNASSIEESDELLQLASSSFNIIFTSSNFLDMIIFLLQYWERLSTAERILWVLAACVPATASIYSVVTIKEPHSTLMCILITFSIFGTGVLTGGAECCLEIRKDNANNPANDNLGDESSRLTI